MTEGFILKVKIEDENGETLMSEECIFTTREQCDAFIFTLFGHRLLNWAKNNSDEWKEISSKFGFKKLSEEKQLEILSREPDTLTALWSYYSDHRSSTESSLCSWTVVDRIPLNPTTEKSLGYLSGSTLDHEF